MEKIKISGLWKNKDKKGQTYLTGKLSPVANLLIMPNSFKKEGDNNSPDYFLYLSPGTKKEKSDKKDDL